MARLNVLLAAEESAGVRTLRQVLAAGHRVVGVLTRANEGAAAATAAAARVAGVPCLPVELLRDPAFAEQIRAERVDVLLNVHSLFVVCSEVVAAPAVGSFNLHPGPLPKYAGLNAPSWAVYDGARTYGCTVHWMTSDVDAGAIAFASEFETDEEETGLSLSLKCVRRGLPLLELLLDAAATPEAIPAQPQQGTRRGVPDRGPPHGGRLPWSLSAERVVAFVRACDFRPFRSPWGTPSGSIGERGFGVVRARRTGRSADVEPGTVGESEGDSVLVAAADEWVCVEAVDLDGRPLPPAAVLTRGALCAVPTSAIGLG